MHHIYIFYLREFVNKLECVGLSRGVLQLRFSDARRIQAAVEQVIPDAGAEQDRFLHT
jgi:hypothetical protein